MITYIVGGIIVGFALGWGIYWYLQQSDRRRWEAKWLHLERSPLVTGAVLARAWEQARSARVGLPAPPQEMPPAGEVLEGEIREIEEPAPLAQPDDRPEEPLSALPQAQQPPPSTLETDEGEIVAYCPICHARRPVENAHHVTTRSGHTAVRGTCGHCGGELFAFKK